MSSVIAPENKVVNISSPTPIDSATDYFCALARVLKRLPYHVVDQITTTLLHAYEEERAVYLFGNGGSAALASHFACDLGKGTAMNGSRRFRVLSLTDNIPILTAWANDSNYEDVFAEQLRNFVRPGDVVLAISGSGNSPNVLNGLKVARAAGAYTIGLTGFRGGKLKEICHLCLIVPCDNMQFIEDLHLCVTHSIFSGLRSRLLSGLASPAAEAWRNAVPFHP